MLRVEIGHYNHRKRTRKGYSKNIEVRDEFWELLEDFCEFNESSFRGNYEYNCNVLYFNRCKEFDEWLKQNCATSSELYLFDEIRKEPFGGSILIKRIFIVNSFEKRAQKVTYDYAYFNKNTCDGLFKVKLSDKVCGRVRKGDLCKVNVLATQDWLVVDIIKDEDDANWNLNDLLGGY